jgi:hypothetical protein
MWPCRFRGRPQTKMLEAFAPTTVSRHRARLRGGHRLLEPGGAGRPHPRADPRLPVAVGRREGHRPAVAGLRPPVRLRPGPGRCSGRSRRSIRRSSSAWSSTPSSPTSTASQAQELAARPVRAASSSCPLQPAGPASTARTTSSTTATTSAHRRNPPRPGSAGQRPAPGPQRLAEDVRAGLDLAEASSGNRPRSGSVRELHVHRACWPPLLTAVGELGQLAGLVATEDRQPRSGARGRRSGRTTRERGSSS